MALQRELSRCSAGAGRGSGPHNKQEAGEMYQQTIREDLARIGRIGIDPRHIEAYMRLEHGTLDALSKERFRGEVALCAECVIADGILNAESLAKSYGL